MTNVFRTTIAAVFVLAANSIVLQSASAEDVSFRLTTGVDYSSGNYGQDQDTDILYIPVTGRLDWDRFRIKVTVPYIKVDGPGGVVGGDAPIIIEGGAPLAMSESGIGDITLSVGAIVFHSPTSQFAVELTGKVKIPTADEEKGLGTGEADYSIQADVSRKLGDFTPFATLGYRVFGDGDDFDLNNTVYASLGGSYRFSQQFSFGTIMDYRQATTDTSAELLEFVPYMNWKIGNGVSFNLYGVIGLSAGSPDAGVGLQISYDFQKKGNKPSLSSPQRQRRPGDNRPRPGNYQ